MRDDRRGKLKGKLQMDIYLLTAYGRNSCTTCSLYRTLEDAFASVPTYPEDNEQEWSGSDGVRWWKCVNFDRHLVDSYSVAKLSLSFPDTPLNQFALAILAGDPVACDAARDVIEKGG